MFRWFSYSKIYSSETLSDLSRQFRIQIDIYVSKNNNKKPKRISYFMSAREVSRPKSFDSVANPVASSRYTSASSLNVLLGTLATTSRYVRFLTLENKKQKYQSNTIMDNFSVTLIAARLRPPRRNWPGHRFDE